MLEIQLQVPGCPVQTRQIDVGRYSIGRGFGADIRLRHDSVARRHALLSIAEDAALLTDIGAADSVRRNGVVVSDTAPARGGDTFSIGDCELKIVRSLIDERPVTEGETTVVIRTAALTSVASDRSCTEPVASLRVLQEELQRLVLRELDLFRRTALNTLASADLRREARQAIESIIESGAVALPPDLDRSRFVAEMTAEIMGYGPIEPFLSDESVSEVMVNGPGQVYIERRGQLAVTQARFTNDESLMRVIERIVTPLGRRIDEGVPMVDARLPDGSRVNAIIPPLSLVGPILTIRKFSRQRLSMDRLVELGSLTPPMCEFLRVCVRYRKNILVSGGTGSGKTTFLNALSESICASERIVTIEDAAELRLAQPHVLSLEARPPNVEGRGEITIRDLVRNALRMRPDRIIVGECRGGEALDMLQAMNTGHDGSMTTGHANSPRDLLSRLEVMVLMAGMDLPVRAIREQIASAVDIIVQQTRFSDGRRRVTSIIEIDGMEGDVILTQPLFAFKQQGVGSNGEIVGTFRGCGQAPRFYEALAEAGVPLDRSIFATASASQRGLA
ncbi:pilus assembly protein CpaF [Povalibacter uvarum]|uniref:Pilus assembly protein CpaF n=1 Tax=Povalibacter uvarum TaxID=732238 RepID=A0A841HJQ8_9GAMM|nr:pilus assembly protein CpaF [Povalibacter uvarum]